MSKFVSSRKVATPASSSSRSSGVPAYTPWRHTYLNFMQKLLFSQFRFIKFSPCHKEEERKKNILYSSPFIARAKARTLLCIHCLLSFVVSVLLLCALFSLLFLLLPLPLLLLYFASGCYQQSTLCCASYALICIHCPCSSCSPQFSLSFSVFLSLFPFVTACLFLFSMPCFGCGVNVICGGRQKYFQLSLFELRLSWAAGRTVPRPPLLPAFIVYFACKCVCVCVSVCGCECECVCVDFIEPFRQTWLTYCCCLAFCFMPHVHRRFFSPFFLAYLSLPFAHAALFALVVSARWPRGEHLSPGQSPKSRTLRAWYKSISCVNKMEIL